MQGRVTVVLTGERKFPLGGTSITRNALETLDPDDVTAALLRHQSGDWGDVDADDREANEEGLRSGDRLLSVYRSGETVFWVITEHDRSRTTVLLPEDY